MISKDKFQKVKVWKAEKKWYTGAHCGLGKSQSALDEPITMKFSFHKFQISEKRFFEHSRDPGQQPTSPRAIYNRD